jgi:hypothetical protein
VESTGRSARKCKPDHSTREREREKKKKKRKWGRVNDEKVRSEQRNE